MILSERRMKPLELPCSCGCGAVAITPQRLRHVVKQGWRYRMITVRLAGVWYGFAITEAFYFPRYHARHRAQLRTVRFVAKALSEKRRERWRKARLAP